MDENLNLKHICANAVRIRHTFSEDSICESYTGRPIGIDYATDSHKWNAAYLLLFLYNPTPFQAIIFSATVPDAMHLLRYFQMKSQLKI